MISRKRLERLARQDSATSAPAGRFDGEAEPSTPTVQAIQAHANTCASCRELRSSRKTAPGAPVQGKTEIAAVRN